MPDETELGYAVLSERDDGEQDREVEGAKSRSVSVSVEEAEGLLLELFRLRR